jgi:hypothetical protein
MPFLTRCWTVLSTTFCASETPTFHSPSSGINPFLSLLKGNVEQPFAPLNSWIYLRIDTSLTYLPSKKLHYLNSCLPYKITTRSPPKSSENSIQQKNRWTWKISFSFKI